MAGGVCPYLEPGRYPACKASRERMLCSLAELRSFCRERYTACPLYRACVHEGAPVGARALLPTLYA